MNVARIKALIAVAKLLVKPVGALVEAIKENRRERIQRRIEKERERQRKQDFEMLQRLIDEEKARRAAKSR